MLARDRARQAFEMAHEQFLAGATSNLDLLNAEKRGGRRGRRRGTEQIGVFKALGGGWQM